jgi:hypothetical protein
MTQSAFLERMLVLSGISICLGWYAALVYEYVKYDRFCHPLYKNMPSMISQYMILETNDDGYVGGILDFESATSLSMMALSHVLDLLGHPLLTYYLWRCHNRRVGVRSSVHAATAVSMSDVAAHGLTWPVVLAAYAASRMWSLTHTYYNFGYFGLFYIGHDVYLMDDLDSWCPAYIAEGVIFGSVILWKLFLQPPHCAHFDGPGGTSSSACDGTSVVAFEKTPRLLLSESSISVNSITQI